MCRTCNCQQKETPCYKECCRKSNVPSTALSTSFVFYQLENTDSPRLFGLNVGNGTPLNTILEQFDDKLNNQAGFNYKGYNMPYLSNKYVIQLNKDFAEAVSADLETANRNIQDLNTKTNAHRLELERLTSDVKGIKYPTITDTGFIGFTNTDSINRILQKMSDKFAALSEVSVFSPPLTAINSNSVLLSAGGVSNHTLSAAVKRSASSGNALQILSDGLYVAAVSPDNSKQTLTLLGNSLSISGGNAVTLPIPQLSFSNTSLSIVGGNTVNLSSLISNSQTPITAQNSTTILLGASGTNNHTLVASVKFSAVAGNQLVDNVGLYVPAPNPASILTEIAGNSILQSQFCGVASNCKPSYRFNVRNEGVSAVDFLYTDSSGVPQTVSIGASVSLTVINVWKVTTLPTITFVITFLGNT